MVSNVAECWPVPKPLSFACLKPFAIVHSRHHWLPEFHPQNPYQHQNNRPDLTQHLSTVPSANQMGGRLNGEGEANEHEFTHIVNVLHKCTLYWNVAIIKIQINFSLWINRMDGILELYVLRCIPGNFRFSVLVLPKSEFRMLHPCVVKFEPHDGIWMCVFSS